MKDIKTCFNKNKNFTRRRNIIRRVFLCIFVLSLSCCTYNRYFYYQKHTPRIEVLGNFFILKQEITNRVLAETVKKNYFTLSSREISKELCDSMHLIKDVLIRKYIFPEFKIVVYVKEKTIWAKIKERNLNNNNFNLLTDEGDVIIPDYIDVALLPKQLVTVVYKGAPFPTKKTFSFLCNINRVFRQELNLAVSNYSVDRYNDLVISTPNGLNIKLGKLEEKALKRVSMLKEVLPIIKQMSYQAGYLDLTLERGATFKNSLIDKGKFNPFENRMRKAKN